MKLLARLPLRLMLTLPCMLLLAGTIGALSCKAGRDAVDSLFDQLLTETVNRIAQAVDRRVAGSAAVPETAFPKGLATPRSGADEQAALRTRWVLQALALRLKDTVRSDDVVARYAGDEFLVVLGSVASRADARRLREQIEARLREPLQAMVQLGERGHGDGAAIGLAMYPDDGRAVDSLIQVADLAMYSRKPAA